MVKHELKASKMTDRDKLRNWSQIELLTNLLQLSALANPQFITGKYKWMKHEEEAVILNIAII